MVFSILASSFLLPGGGISNNGLQKFSDFLSAVKTILGFKSRVDKVTKEGKDDLGSGNPAPPKNKPAPKEPEFWFQGFKGDQPVNNKTTRGKDTIEVEGTNYYSNGKRDSTARGTGQYERTNDGKSKKIRPLQTEKGNN